MNKIFILTLISFLFVSNGYTQVFKKADPVICPVDPKSYDTFITPPKYFQNELAKGARANATANIIVNYNGFTDEAQAAFQYAVDIWASLLKSPVPIIVNANFADLGQGVLGSAGPSNFVRDFEGAPVDTTFYPIPLAEKLAGRSLNGENEADINANFSSTFDFYFGLDGNPPSDEFDFVSIVLHELGHGLGFTGAVTFNEDNQTGSWDLGTTEKSSIYTKFTQLGDGTLITSLPASSEETGDAFTSNNLFFNGALATSILGENPRLYAPSTWNGGSSFSHLDENTYPAGDENSLMSPQFGRGEAIHDPGVSLDIFADMGWVHTYVTHVNKFQITSNTTDAFEVSISVTSDTSFNTLQPVLHYSTDNFETIDDVTMTLSGQEYIASIPNTGSVGKIQYYFDGIEDALSRSYTSPYNAPYNFYEINIINEVTKSLPYLNEDGGNFETNLNDFISVALTGGVNIWELGEPENKLNQTSSGSNVWKTNLTSNIGKPNISYSSALISPTFDFSNDQQNHLLKFKFSMENAYREDIGVFNSGPIGFNVQYTLDEGESWVLLGDLNDQKGTNWYNVGRNTSSTFPIDAPAGWIKQTIEEVIDGDTTFINEDVNYNVSFLAGNSKVQFRIVFYVTQDFIDAGYNADGVLIDDFEIETSNPTADFIVDASGFIFPGRQVNFEYISTGASEFLWDFGDGNTSTLENPSHIYTEGGFYDVTLTVNGNTTLIKENLIRVIAQKSIPYTLEEGGNLENEVLDFSIFNVSGTGFEVGESSVSGKSGTASGSVAIVTGINEDTYENDSEAYIYMPEFDFNILGSYELSFETNYSFEDNWDGFIVEYTLNRGETWIKLNNVQEENWYNQISDPQSVFGSEVPIFSGDTGGQFEEKKTDISFLGGLGLVGFRVKFLSDAAEVEAGMAIDNFQIKGPVQGAVVANFNSSLSEACTGSSVLFTNESVGSITSVRWDFGNGASPQTADSFGPHEVTYSTSGQKTVKLILTNNIDEEIIEEKVDYINIGNTHTPTFEAGERNTDFTRLLTSSEGESYQWFISGDSIPNATEQTYLASVEGSYSVAVKIDGCIGFSSTENIITANNSAINKSFMLYPNPSKRGKEITFSFENEYLGEYDVKIMNLLGKVVFNKSKKKNSSATTQGISTQNLRSGIYILKVKTGSTFAQRKFIIE